jgi:membrane protease YdiL (CAAX protease family)
MRRAVHRSRLDRLDRLDSRREKGPAPLALLVYGIVAAGSLAVSWALGKDPLESGAPSWLPLPAGTAELVSAALGVILALTTIRASRAFVRRWAWAKALHADLRPTVRGVSGTAILLLGSASGIAEELFFRGLLAPALGVILSSLAFGALHQFGLRGRAGWVWATWATLMGVLFGALFFATGSLVGPIVAHVAINVVNLRFIRDTDVGGRRPRALGGLLGEA